MDEATIDPARAPFLFIPTSSPRHAAEQLVSAFRRVAEIEDRVSWTHAAIAGRIGPPTDAVERALDAAGRAIAAAVDSEAVFHDRHAYHNRQHFCEVMLTAHFLCGRHELQPVEARLVLLAALVHDLEHDGAPGQPFVYERRSVARAAPHLETAGVDAPTAARMAALVLATEPRHGTAAAVSAHRAHLRGDAPCTLAGRDDELSVLATDARLAQAAVLLCEADLLPSVGLTRDYAIDLQARLSREWRCPLDRADKLRFLDAVVEAGVIGAFFLPNVRALRRAIAEPTDADAL